VRGSYRWTAIIVLILLTILLTACGRWTVDAGQPTGPQPSAPSSTPYFDLNKMKEERQRLEQQLADYEKKLEQIWQYVGETTS